MSNDIGIGFEGTTIEVNLSWYNLAIDKMNNRFCINCFHALTISYRFACLNIMMGLKIDQWHGWLDNARDKLVK